MKKKLLSLVLAGAMVASTSVSAFAAETDTVTTESVTISKDKTEQDVNIGITGNVLDNNGNAKPGTINVTVPTATTFAVTKEGTLTSPKMVITNNSDEKLIVVASKFEDSDGPENINIVTKKVFDAKEANTNPEEKNDRGTIWLRLEGSTKNLGLTSEDNGDGNGKMYNGDYSETVTDSTPYEIGKIGARGNMTLTLNGQGGVKGTANNAIKDTFKLVLKIKRDRV